MLHCSISASAARRAPHCLACTMSKLLLKLLCGAGFCSTHLQYHQDCFCCCVHRTSYRPPSSQLLHKPLQLGQQQEQQQACSSRPYLALRILLPLLLQPPLPLLPPKALQQQTSPLRCMRPARK